MKKVATIVILIVAIISGIAIFPVAAFAECSNEITAGDRDSLCAMSGHCLADGYDVEICYKNYILYSSGVYQAFIITFDSDFCENYFNNDANDNNMLYVFELLFSNRGYTLQKDQENAQFTASVKYDSQTAMYAEMQVDGYENNEKSGEEVKGFFFNRFKTTNKTVFSNIQTSGNLFNAILHLCAELGIPSERVLLNYTYGTPYKIIKTDADDTKYLAGQKIYTHSYSMNMDNYDREITLSQTTPNSRGWYIMAIIISLIVVVLPLTLVIIRKKEVKNG